MIRIKKNSKTVVIVGCGALARETARQLAGKATVVGAFSIRPHRVIRDLGVPHLGRAEELGDYLAMEPMDEVYLAGDVCRDHNTLQAAVETCERLGIPFAVPAHIFRLGRALPCDASSVRDGYLHYSITISRPFHDFCKRSMDLALSLLALMALSPLLLAVALAIKLTSTGPVLFKQVRVGLRGKPFAMYKFRSMVVNAEHQLQALSAKNEQTGPVFKIQNDPRVTKIGRVIRRYSIDELPQLLNIVKGEMSIVGPRPPLPSEVDQYAPWQRRRLSVRPGLTCLWQVKGRNNVSFDEWMLLDLQYVDQWSLGKDAALIGRTIPVVVTGKGAS